MLLARDWGGAVGWKIAYKYPDVITKLVAMNCPYPAAFEAKIRSDLSQLFYSWYINSSTHCKPVVQIII